MSPTPTLEHYQRWAQALSNARGVLAALLETKRAMPWIVLEDDLRIAIEEMRPFAVAARVDAILSASVDGRRMAETVKHGSVRSTTSAVPQADAQGDSA